MLNTTRERPSTRVVCFQTTHCSVILNIDESGPLDLGAVHTLLHNAMYRAWRRESCSVPPYISYVSRSATPGGESSLSGR